MKRFFPLFLAMTVGVAAFGETIRIGTMDLPLRFEGEAPTGAVYDFATNEIVRYYHSVVGFLGLSPDAPQPAHINEKTRATMVWLSPGFQDKVNFFVDSGSTNCVVSSAFVTNAAAIYTEWNERTNLTAAAEAFLQSVSSGTITNLPASDLRLRHRTVSSDGNGLVPVSASEASDDELRDMFSRMSSEWTFEPICLMEMSRQPLGTNEVWFLPVRTDQPNEQGYSRDILPLRLVFFDNIWSLLY